MRFHTQTLVKELGIVLLALLCLRKMTPIIRGRAIFREDRDRCRDIRFHTTTLVKVLHIVYLPLLPLLFLQKCDNCSKIDGESFGEIGRDRCSKITNVFQR